MNIAELRLEAAGCKRCALAATRTQVVVGTGPCPSPLMILGEAPGASEDAAGTPYAGRSGEILDELLALIGLARERAYLANVLMCRPPGNRGPAAEEIEACSHWLFTQLKLVRPQVLVTFGSFATTLFSASPRAFAKVIGKPEEIRVADHRLWLYPLSPPWLCAAGAMRKQLERRFRLIPELLERELSAQDDELAAEQPRQLGLLPTGAYGEAS
jgi:uracil-DNA glycosylase family 4